MLEVVKAMSPVQEALRRQLNPVVMTAAEFSEQLATQDRFVSRVRNEPKVFVLGSPDEFEKFADDRAARKT
jgi:hypothetical protein